MQKRSKNNHLLSKNMFAISMQLIQILCCFATFSVTQSLDYSIVAIKQQIDKVCFIGTAARNNLLNNLEIPALSTHKMWVNLHLCQKYTQTQSD